MFEWIVLFIISKTTQGNHQQYSLFWANATLKKEYMKLSENFLSIPFIAMWPVKASYAFAVVKTASNKSLYILQVEIKFRLILM